MRCKTLFSTIVGISAVSLWLAACSACSQAKHPAKNSTPKQYQRKDLELGQQAYIRVREVSTESQEKLQPKGVEFKVSFGDKVSLLKRGETNIFYLIEKDGKQGWLGPANLTANKEEIEFLQQINKIPSTTSFVYEKDGFAFVQGLMMATVTSMSGNAQGSARSSVSKEGNAVFFDSNVIKSATPVLTLGCNDKTFKLNSNVMYYCNGVDKQGIGCFDCVDLRTLSVCKD